MLESIGETSNYEKAYDFCDYVLFRVKWISALRDYNIPK